MNNNAALKYKVYNPEKKDCPVSRMFNSLYMADEFQREQQIPEDVGKGYGIRYVLNQSTEIFISDATFYENITIQEEAYTSPHYGLSFCLEDPFRWQMDGSRKEYEMSCGESYIFNGLSGSNSSTYRAGMRFLGLSFQYSPDVIYDMVAHMSKRNASRMPECNENPFYLKKFSPRIKLILNDILHCQYRGSIKKIYLEGKVLELLAVYQYELILETERSNTPPRLSSADVDALHHARKILNDNLVSPPTIRLLARLVCLNEYKLKAGFRELFGMPIHAYIIDKRLELSRLLILEQELSVAEAALLVGYSNTNHFTEKFKIKYGIRPSEYRVSIQENSTVLQPLQ